MINVKTAAWANIRTSFSKYLLDIEKYEILEELLIQLVSLSNPPVIQESSFKVESIDSGNAVSNLLTLTLETTEENALMLQRFYKDINPKFNPGFMVLNAPSLQPAIDKINIIFTITIDPELVENDLLPLFEEHLSTHPKMVTELYAKQRYTKKDVHNSLNNLLAKYGLSSYYGDALQAVVLATASSHINVTNHTRRFFEKISFPKELRALPLEYLGVLHPDAIDTTEEDIVISSTHVRKHDGDEHNTFLGFVTTETNAMHVVNYFNRFNKNLAEYCGVTYELDGVFHTQGAGLQTVSIQNVAFTHPFFIAHLEETMSLFSRVQMESFRHEQEYNFRTTTRILSLINQAKSSLTNLGAVDLQEKTQLLLKIEELEAIFNQKGYFTIKELDSIQKLSKEARSILDIFRGLRMTILKDADSKTYSCWSNLNYKFPLGLDAALKQSQWYLDNQDK